MGRNRGPPAARSQGGGAEISVHSSPPSLLFKLKPPTRRDRTQERCKNPSARTRCLTWPPAFYRMVKALHLCQKLEVLEQMHPLLCNPLGPVRSCLLSAHSTPQSACEEPPYLLAGKTPLLLTLESPDASREPGGRQRGGSEQGWEAGGQHAPLHRHHQPSFQGSGPPGTPFSRGVTPHGGQATRAASAPC